ncbi:YciI family protein [Nonomuraea sp. NPDC049480]|uniref:YciI family protein n=1 Tax=Nonomuraea sp. NPDC049480 TaxID=3364353 RepID=UPI0037A76FDE
MQYLVSVIFDEAELATPDEMAAIDVFNDRLVAEDYWVFAAGLGAPGTATVIDNAPDLDVALKLAAEGSKACNRKVEVRPFL